MGNGYKIIKFTEKDKHGHEEEYFYCPLCGDKLIVGQKCICWRGEE